MVRAEIDTELFAQFSAQSMHVPSIEITEKPAEASAPLDVKNTLELAKLRTQIKKLEKQLSVRDDLKKRELLTELIQQLETLQGT